MSEVVLVPRTDEVGRLIRECAERTLAFSGPDSLCEKVHNLGFKTTSLYEMVRAAEESLR